MRELSVMSTPSASGWSCVVQINEDNGQTRHRVDVKRADFEKYVTGKEVSVEELVKKSFEFLLERERKESILRQFSLPDINEYFPEYASEIVKRLK